jgi:hypothetical protein
VYDNGGATADRYSVFVKLKNNVFEIYGMSSDPFSPQGFNQYGGDATLKQKNDFIKFQKPKKIAIDKLPEVIKTAIKQRIEGDV